MNTRYNTQVDDQMTERYLAHLVGRFYKILPIREEQVYPLKPYLDSLLRELTGLNRLVEQLEHDEIFLSILSLLQYLADHDDADVNVIKTEVFHAINLVDKLKERHFPSGGDCLGRME